MDISIFDAFPNAIISGVWEIGTCQHGTLVGNTFTKIADLNVIVDEGSNSSTYMLHNNQNDGYYEIVDAGIGKNQHTGNIEHLELKVVRTEVTNG